VDRVVDCSSVLDNKQENYDIEDDERIHGQIDYKDYSSARMKLARNNPAGIDGYKYRYQ
jgi:hypothetical protein